MVNNNNKWGGGTEARRREREKGEKNWQNIFVLIICMSMK